LVSRIGCMIREAGRIGCKWSTISCRTSRISAG
jgi:hypothetical protein